jgi:hypothetical protein
MPVCAGKSKPVQQFYRLASRPATRIIESNNEGHCLATINSGCRDTFRILDLFFDTGLQMY